MSLEKVAFDRATSEGWVPVEGVKIGPLAAASYERQLYRYFEIFHVETGLAFGRKLGRFPGDLKEAIKLAKKVSSFPEWDAIKRRGKKPGNCTLTKRAGKLLAEKIVKAWGSA